MKVARVIPIVVMALMLIQPLTAENAQVKVENKFKEYVNGVVQDVKQADNPAEKRSVLNNSFEKALHALNTAEKLPSLTEEDHNFVNLMREKFQGYQAELNGQGGYEAVPNSDLDNFASYVQQDLEQAEKYVTISLTTLLLVVIIIILLA